MFKIDFHLIVYRYEAILALIVLLLTGSIAVSSRDSERPFPPSRRYPYRIALTFDDGPHPVFTDRLASILRQESAKATFFVVGSRMIEYPYLASHLAAEGHELAGHTFSHRNLSRLSDEEIKRELMITRRLIRDIAKQDGRFFRPPGGQYDDQVVSAAGRLGQDMVLWTVFPKDHEENDPDVIVRKVIEQATDGGIILLHSGRLPTLEALPKIIRELRSRGYRFVTVSDISGPDIANGPDRSARKGAL